MVELNSMNVEQLQQKFISVCEETARYLRLIITHYDVITRKLKYEDKDSIRQLIDSIISSFGEFQNSEWMTCLMDKLRTISREELIKFGEELDNTLKEITTESQKFQCCDISKYVLVQKPNNKFVLEVCV